MTTIAAVQGDGWVVMGADTQSTVAEYRVVKMDGDKVINNNGILIAGCGMGRGMNLLQLGWVAPKPRKLKNSVEELELWMVRTFVPKMRELFVKGGYDMKDDGDFAQHENVFLVAVQGVLFIVDDDYSVDRDARKYLTSGSGGDFAQGVLYLCGKSEDLFTDIEIAKAALRDAVDAAKEFDIYSGGETKIYVQLAK